MSKSSNYTEKQLQRAVDAYKSNSKLKITSLSREFKVSYATLFRDCTSHNLNIYNDDDDVCDHFIPPPADQLSTVFLQLTFSETVAKLHHQINAAAKALEDVKDTLTPGLTRRLNKIFKDSMVQAELNAHHEGELADHYQANRH
ncbi:uncharacterized protein BDCG_17832 [Blastomyces dermatitidis ER-3]|uniref:HTH psq-type domain-containing protein n=1 Tax=Ajellomyces dermatitidis (strain ER-3 / ATCC MYA-2586) TaxID=559297 RepID=A0ABX2W0K8_AJEDR|nr:uncharacterized protein BDCG_17832 [Blastomyces dermatitidis ER-3]OAT02919.1 hypothetical protein BDCG_17832 [Blastomyces dermatitidis ER-3]